MKTHLITKFLVILLLFCIQSAYAQRNEFGVEKENQTDPDKRENPRKNPPHRVNDFMSLITPLEKAKIYEAHEIKSNKIIPRWYCPFLEVDTYYYEVELAIGNFSIKPVKVRLILWNYDGSMESSCDFEIEGKAHIVFLLGYGKTEFISFLGSIEIQSDSPAIFPSVKYLAEGTISNPSIPGSFKTYTESFTLDWYRLDK